MKKKIIKKILWVFVFILFFMLGMLFFQTFLNLQAFHVRKNIQQPQKNIFEEYCLIEKGEIIYEQDSTYCFIQNQKYEIHEFYLKEMNNLENIESRSVIISK